MKNNTTESKDLDTTKSVSDAKTLSPDGTKKTEKSTSTSATPNPNKNTNKPTEHLDKKSRDYLPVTLSVIALLISAGAAYQNHMAQSLQNQQIADLKKQIALVAVDEKQQNVRISQNSQYLEKYTDRTQGLLNQQQESIENLQASFAKLKGQKPSDWLISEANYLANLAARKLFIDKDTTTAAILLEQADAQIARLNDPSLMPLRQAIADDVLELKSIPTIDVQQIVVQLSAVEKIIDTLPLSNSLLTENTDPVKNDTLSNNVSDWKDNLLSSLKQFSKNFITFRVRDGKTEPLLSPQQDFYLKENIKTKLETAIKAVYNQQQTLYQNSIAMAINWMSQYLERNDPRAQFAINQLQNLYAQNIRIILPTKLNSLDALHQVSKDRLQQTNKTSTMPVAKQKSISHATPKVLSNSALNNKKVPDGSVSENASADQLMPDKAAFDKAASEKSQQTSALTIPAHNKEAK